MKENIKALVRPVLPVRLVSWWRQCFGWRWFRGNFGDWAEARAAARGYDDGAVLERVIAAARAARKGQGAWDRDGVVFAQPTVHRPLLRALEQAAAENDSCLCLVDFGGALGSTWWQHRSALQGFTVSWRIVEQTALVEVGRKEFTDGVLSFHHTMRAALTDGPVHAMLFSSVLPYLEKPHATLAEAVSLRVPHVILDRTPFVTGGGDRLVVQFTPPQLGGGSYPCWLFDRQSLLTTMQAEYDLVAEWPVEFDRVDGTVDYHGMHFRLRRRGVASSRSTGP